MFNHLKQQDTVNILYKNNEIKKDTVSNINSRDGLVSFTLAETKLKIKCKGNQAIYRHTDKDNDVLIFIA